MEEFCVVTQFQNITKAAEYLYISQPTLSRHISELEESVGVQLIIRDNRSFRLTDAGELLYQHATDVLGRVAEIKRQMKRLGSGEKGRLSVCSVNVYHPALYETYRRFRAAYRGIAFSVVPLNSRDSASAIIQGRYDVGIVFSFDLPAERGGLDAILLLHDEMQVVVSDGHPLARKSEVALSALQNESNLYIDGKNGLFGEQEPNDFIWDLSSRHSAGGVPFKSATATGSLDSLVMSIRAGLGVSLLPGLVAREHASGCRILKIADFDAGFDVPAVWRQDNPSTSLKLFQAMLRERFPA